MKKIIAITLTMFFGTMVAKAGGGVNPDKPEHSSSDTSVSVKSNIVIFKILQSPTNTNSNNNNSGSLKKAGKVARISTQPHTIVDSSFVYKKRPI